jgi:predicted negative regulator of RcsB-dependent stress response
MKTAERHQLKHNEVADTLQDVYGRIESNRKTIFAVIVAILLVGGAAVAMMYVSSQKNDKASAMLADAVAVTEAQVVPPIAGVPGQPAPPPPPAGSYPSDAARMEAALPKFMAAADAYPTTESGISARYRAAALLATLGRAPQAREQYQKVAAADGRGLYGRMSLLALAQLDVQDKKYDTAIAALRELSLDAKGDLPIDAILVQLGQTCVAAGKPTEARQALERVTTEFATSPYAADARKTLDSIKGQLSVGAVAELEFGPTYSHYRFRTNRRDERKRGADRALARAVVPPRRANRPRQRQAEPHHHISRELGAERRLPIAPRRAGRPRIADVREGCRVHRAKKRGPRAPAALGPPERHSRFQVDERHVRACEHVIVKAPEQVDRVVAEAAQREVAVVAAQQEQAAGAGVAARNSARGAHGEHAVADAERKICAEVGRHGIAASIGSEGRPEGLAVMPAARPSSGLIE